MLLRYALLLVFYSYSSFSFAYDPSDEALCKEWAFQDGIPAEEVDSYIKECLQSIDYQEPAYEEPVAEEENETDSAVYGLE